MKIDILTIFPEMFRGPFDHSIIKRAREKELIEINIHNLRNWTTDKHMSVDDTPYGGGGGMVMMIEPIHRALQDLRTEESIVIATTAKGEQFKQSTAKQLVAKQQDNEIASQQNNGKAKHSKKHLIILAGHYEGFDQRILDELVDIPISIGNYVLTGGELPAMIIVDAVTRLLPGVVGNEETPRSDSYYTDDKTKQYPIYTKPAQYKIGDKILAVPDVLLSGNHEEIKKWRNQS